MIHVFYHWIWVGSHNGDLYFAWPGCVIGFVWDLRDGVPVIYYIDWYVGEYLGGDGVRNQVFYWWAGVRVSMIFGCLFFGLFSEGEYRGHLVDWMNVGIVQFSLKSFDEVEVFVKLNVRTDQVCERGIHDTKRFDQLHVK